MTAAQAVFDVTDATFAAEVLERSKQTAVVVDFWAPWCGPCRMLGPIIEKLAGEFAPDVVVAKLNTDENPQTATQFRIQGIPAVKAFRDGRVVAEFTGALPEPQVRAFFARVLPSPAEIAARDAARFASAGDSAAAEAAYRDALAATPSNADAIVGLARILLARGERREAEKLLERAPIDRRAKSLRHRIFLDDFAEKHAKDNLETEAANNPRDARARYRWGVMLAAREQYEAALEELIESVRLDKTLADGAARKAVLAIFDILGLESPLAKEYQRKLSAAIF
ncbi:thioredoxin [bacterium]|jgi:putative thioredoxin|nr:thioredoxin [bacterium]